MAWPSKGPSLPNIRVPGLMRNTGSDSIGSDYPAGGLNDSMPHPLSGSFSPDPQNESRPNPFQKAKGFAGIKRGKF